MSRGLETSIAASVACFLISKLSVSILHGLESLYKVQSEFWP
jgi:hypothetical protein